MCRETISSENIIKYYDYLILPKKIITVTQFMDMPLSKYIETYRKTSYVQQYIEQGIDLFKQMATALKYLKVKK